MPHRIFPILNIKEEMPILDIVVTTPKGERLNSAREAADCIAAGGGLYMRTLIVKPVYCQKGSKVFYVDNNFVTGFCKVLDTVTTSEEAWKFKYYNNFYPRVYYAWNHFNGMYILMDATTWHWIEFIPMNGFQGFNYRDFNYRITGDWLDPKPEEPFVLR